MSRQAALTECSLEMIAQDAKWGEQDRPSFKFPPHGGTKRTPSYGLPTSEHAKIITDGAAKNGTLSWGDILLEELCEAFDAPDDANLREELIQVAAVALQWVGCLDRIHLPAVEDVRHHLVSHHGFPNRTYLNDVASDEEIFEAHGSEHDWQGPHVH